LRKPPESRQLGNFALVPLQAEQRAITFLPMQVELLFLERNSKRGASKDGLVTLDPSLSGDVHEK
jgi:hypothetical protein